MTSDNMKIYGGRPTHVDSIHFRWALANACKKLINTADRFIIPELLVALADELESFGMSFVTMCNIDGSFTGTWIIHKSGVCVEMTYNRIEYVYAAFGGKAWLPESYRRALLGRLDSHTARLFYTIAMHDKLGTFISMIDHKPAPVPAGTTKKIIVGKVLKYFPVTFALVLLVSVVLALIENFT